ncbi:hypothetical protein FJ970_10260 [Mesorhizobium sp. B2-1-8]|uniref:hypothetical protein n=1 Tax=unclassified Mesorhizobium TaxID=325217 RepID=UPI001128FEBC|nr:MULTISPECIES: hypothetical protein [unclassified Mesorhizobium]MBZ9670661.1 hypothetical protein [Mesorhizobium sp. ES1-3]UCI21309.1 hypothetical protein FJ970_10260 [Mesorhizobium sp. B2-1-8]
MPFPALRSPPREDVDERRLGRLVRLLQAMQVEIERETQLHLSEADCAAFSVQALDNGEDLEIISARIDTLTNKVMLNHTRQASLQRQLSFLRRTQAELQRLLPSHRT